MKLLIALLFAVSAQAERYHFVHARGTYGASTTEAKEIFATTQQIWLRETGRALVAKTFVSRRNPFQRIHENGLSGRATVLWLWQQLGQRTHKLPIVAMVPPFNEGGLYYMAGMALRCDDVAFAVAEGHNQLGEPRSIHSSIGLAHEVGHLSGAEHDDSEPISIMNSNALPYSNLDMHFSERSKQEMRRCEQ